jgi:hypothetical protein
MAASPMSKLSFALVLLAASQAQAALPVLPNPQASGTVFFNLGPRTDSSTLGPISLTDPRWGTVALDMAGQPRAAVTASAQMTNTNFSALYGRAVGTLGFFFAVDGPGPQVDVDIGIVGSVTASASNGASFVVRATWELWNEAGQVTLLASNEISTPQMSGSFSDSFGGFVTRRLDIGHVYFVRMVANAEAAATNPGTSASAFAFVDPVFSIGAGFDPSLYTFGLSAGIGNQPVPEPAAGALLALGLAVLAWRRRA